MRKKKKKPSGPKGSRYFFAYSENMLGRAISDSAFIFLDYNPHHIKKILINLQLPNIPRDKTGRYGVLYGTTQNIQTLLETAQHIELQKLQKCQEHSLEKAITFLTEHQDITQVREFYKKNKPHLLPGLLGTGWKTNDLGFYLHGILHPLVGTIYRENINHPILKDTLNSQNFIQTINANGISELRKHPHRGCTKAPKNQSPHTIEIYAHQNDLEQLQKTKQQLLTQ